MKLRAAVVAAFATALSSSAFAQELTAEDFAKVPNIGGLSGLSMNPEGTFVTGLIAQPGSDNELEAMAVWDISGELPTDTLIAPSVVTPTDGKMRFVAASAFGGDKIRVVANQAWSGSNPCTEGGSGAGAVDTFAVKVFWTDNTLEDFEEGIAGLGEKRIRDPMMEQCMRLNGRIGIYNSLPLEENTVILSAFDPNADKTDLFKVNFETGERQSFFPRDGVGDIVFSDPRNGDALARGRVEFRDGKYLVETWILDAEKNTFVLADALTYDVRDRYTMAIAGWDETSGQYYIVTDKFSDKAAVHAYDPKTDTLETEPLLAHPDYSVTGLAISTMPHNFNEVLGFSYGADISRVYWLDPEIAAIQEGLEKAFPDQNVALRDWNRDMSRILVVTSSSAHPPSYFILSDKSKLSVIGSSRPWIDSDQLRKTEFISYSARDGLEIPGFLTLPKGWKREDGPIPAVVVPHGGPWARDDANWDPTGWPQFLASRGYAVLQPQYRGSEGFGLKLWRAGDAEWGQKMQDDKDDGARWMVSQGIADPDKIAIFGYSYGGFAAFAATVRENGPFRCAIAGAGVSNVALFQRIVGGNRISRQVQGWTIDGMDPMKNVDKANIPILVYHGDRDVRVPIKEGRGFYNRVKDKVPAKFLEVDDMPHSLPWWPEHHRITLNAIDDYLKNDCGFDG